MVFSNTRSVKSTVSHFSQKCKNVHDAAVSTNYARYRHYHYSSKTGTILVYFLVGNLEREIRDLPL